MAIYTRFGSEIKIIQVKQDDNGDCAWLKCQRDDGSIVADDFVHVSELKADNGFNEINESIVQALRSDS